MRLLAALLLIACATTAGAQAREPESQSNEFLDVKPNAYGLGVNADQYGRPHTYRTEDGQQLPGFFADGVRRDAYGLGVHADEFGRPLHDSKPSD